jgi:hypothetical protein
MAASMGSDMLLDLNVTVLDWQQAKVVPMLMCRMIRDLIKLLKLTLKPLAFSPEHDRHRGDILCDYTINEYQKNSEANCLFVCLKATVLNFDS